MDYCGVGTPAVARLWAYAHERRHVSSRVGGKWIIHADRVHGFVRGPFRPIPVFDLSRDTTRAWRYRAFGLSRRSRRRRLKPGTHYEYTLVRHSRGYVRDLRGTGRF